MTKFLKNLLEGMRQALQIVPPQRAYIINDGGFEQDASRLRGDFQRVGNDMHKVMRRGEQTNYRTS